MKGFLRRLLRRTERTRANAAPVADGAEESTPPRSERPVQAPDHANEAILFIPSVSPRPDELDFANRLKDGLHDRSGMTMFCHKEHILPYGNHDQFQMPKYSIVAEMPESLALQDGECRDISSGYPIVDVYIFEYDSFIKGKGLWGSPLFQAVLNFLLMIAYLLVSFWVFLMSICCSSTCGVQPCQVFIVFVMAPIYFGFFVLYFVVLVLSIVTAALDFVFEEAEYQKYIALVFGIMVLLEKTILPECVKEAFEKNILIFNSLLLFFTPFGEPKRRKTRNQLSCALRRVQNLDRSEQNPYRHIHIVGYSLGSVVGIDALYPATGHDVTGYKTVFGKVDHLVTFGCPFDVTRSYVPSYYGVRRFPREGYDMCWANFYIPEDFLGSNFLNDGGINEPAMLGVDLKENATFGRPVVNKAFTTWNNRYPCLSWFVGGVNAHTRYFDRSDEDEEMAGDLIRYIVDAIFAYPTSHRHWICNWKPHLEDPVEKADVEA